MILVTLGTQDKSFERLLKAIDKEIEKGNIKDKVLVQAGYTKYKSENMEIFKSVSNDRLEELMDEASLIITHGGVGSILTALKHHKKVIATPRLSKYNEHTNDHQKQIIEEFGRLGYIIPLKDLTKLDKMLIKSKTFKPKEFNSNNENFKELITNYIEDSNHISWFNRDKFVILTSLLNLFIFYLLNLTGINIYLNFTITYTISCLFMALFKTKKLSNIITSIICFYLIEGLSLLLLVDNLHIDVILSKFFINILVVIIYHFLVKKN